MECGGEYIDEEGKAMKKSEWLRLLFLWGKGEGGVGYVNHTIFMRIITYKSIFKNT